MTVESPLSILCGRCLAQPPRSEGPNRGGCATTRPPSSPSTWTRQHFGAFYVCMLIFMYLCIYLCLLHVCMYVCIYVCIVFFYVGCMQVCIDVCIACLSVCLSVCLSLCLYVCMYVCMYVCACMHACMHACIGPTLPDVIATRRGLDLVEVCFVSDGFLLFRGPYGAHPGLNVVVFLNRGGGVGILPLSFFSRGS